MFPLDNARVTSGLIQWPGYMALTRISELHQAIGGGGGGGIEGTDTDLTTTSDLTWVDGEVFLVSVNFCVSIDFVSITLSINIFAANLVEIFFVGDLGV